MVRVHRLRGIACFLLMRRNVFSIALFFDIWHDAVCAVERRACFLRMRCGRKACEHEQSRYQQRQKESFWGFSFNHDSLFLWLVLTLKKTSKGLLHNEHHPAVKIKSTVRYFWRQDRRSEQAKKQVDACLTFAPRLQLAETTIMPEPKTTFALVLRSRSVRLLARLLSRRSSSSWEFPRFAQRQ